MSSFPRDTPADPTAEPRVSRLAPSPTGTLHLGNLRTFLFNWLLARARGWRLILRVEDLDAPRVRAEHHRSMLETLEWLGLDHDGPVELQSTDLTPFRQALARLAGAGRAYSCPLSRADLRRVVSAPHEGEREQVYPAHLRPTDSTRFEVGAAEHNYRFVVPAGSVTIDDRLAGPRTFDPSTEVGDFIIWTKNDVPSYQLAVVVDDARQGVTDVVRGDDLLPSAARQSLLYAALGAAEPTWWHVPLVVDESGRRLAKRYGDASVDALRESGVPSDAVIGLLGSWLRADRRRVRCTVHELHERLASGLRSGSLEGLDLRTVAFGEEDRRWLRDASPR